MHPILASLSSSLLFEFLGDWRCVIQTSPIRDLSYPSTDLFLCAIQDGAGEAARIMCVDSNCSTATKIGTSVSCTVLSKAGLSCGRKRFSAKVKGVCRIGVVVELADGGANVSGLTLARL